MKLFEILQQYVKKQTGHVLDVIWFYISCILQLFSSFGLHMLWTSLEYCIVFNTRCEKGDFEGTIKSCFTCMQCTRLYQTCMRRIEIHYFASLKCVCLSNIYFFLYVSMKKIAAFLYELDI